MNFWRFLPQKPLFFVLFCENCLKFDLYYEILRKQNNLGHFYFSLAIIVLYNNNKKSKDCTVLFFMTYFNSYPIFKVIKFYLNFTKYFFLLSQIKKNLSETYSSNFLNHIQVTSFLLILIYIIDVWMIQIQIENYQQQIKN